MSQKPKEEHCSECDDKVVYENLAFKKESVANGKVLKTIIYCKKCFC